MIDYAFDIRKELYPKEEVPEVRFQIYFNSKCNKLYTVWIKKLKTFFLKQFTPNTKHLYFYIPTDKILFKNIYKKLNCILFLKIT